MSDALAVRMASYCGDCGASLVGAGVFYIRQTPARLICQRCKDRERAPEVVRCPDCEMFGGDHDVECPRHG